MASGTERHKDLRMSIQGASHNKGGPQVRARLRHEEVLWVPGILQREHGHCPASLRV